VTTPVPFDRELQPRIVFGPPPSTPEQLAALRAEDATEVPSMDALTRGGRIDVSERTVEGQPGVRVLICTPAGAVGPLPAIYHTHAGGMFSGDHRIVLDPLLDEVEALGVTLVSVAYRLAPEHPYPAPINDVHAGLLWTVEHATELGIDRDRIIAAGTSAGGGLTAALALMLRDTSGPRLLGQLLMSPMLDDRNDSFSVRQMAGLDVWDSSWNGFGWSALLGEDLGGEDVSPYAAPARATDLSGLPPAFLEAGSAESLRDEVVAYAGRIWQCGGRADLHVWDGGCHVFTWIAPEARISRAALAARRAWLERILASTPGPS
jgi:acetyl esterase/lipase